MKEGLKGGRGGGKKRKKVQVLVKRKRYRK